MAGGVVKKNSTPSQEWLFADTVNGSLVADPSIQVPRFDLPRRLWCTLNRFRTGQGRCAASLTHWQQITHPTSCDCGAPQQTMMHIVEDCPVTRFPSGLPALQLADENALIWLDTQIAIRREKCARHLKICLLALNRFLF